MVVEWRSAYSLPADSVDVVVVTAAAAVYCS